MFVDVAKIKIKAGNGGNGKISFHREKYVAAGGPDGGDGGKGGNVVLKADANLSTLADFRYKRKYAAENGEDGKAGRSSGRSGKDLIIKVPGGTLVRDIVSGRIVADVLDGEEKVIVRGGNGGWGNMHFANPTRQAPNFAKPGENGQELEVQLELKLLADVGLIGYPNVGKSTIISVVSAAQPVVGDYHFTTITPVLGVVNRHEGSSFVMADIPGLVEGASEGVGLGHQFLRHVERCRLLVHVVDVSGSEGRDPVDDFCTVNSELAKFNSELAGRPMLVVGNKIDLASDDQVEEFKRHIEEQGYEFFPIMAAISYNMDELMNRVEELVSKLPPVKPYEVEGLLEPVHIEMTKHSVKVNKEGDIYMVEAPWLEKFMQSINLDDYESLQYLDRTLSKYGVMDALHKQGLAEGDTVDIYGFEFDYVE